MRRTALIAAMAAAGLLAGALPAEAESRGRGRGHGEYYRGGGQWVHPQYGPSYRAPHYYYAPRPVYVVPPPVYYAPPPPVYYAPPPPVVVYPGWGYPQGEVSFGLRLPIR
jgi:hypothetical protein